MLHTQAAKVLRKDGYGSSLCWNLLRSQVSEEPVTSVFEQEWLDMSTNKVNGCSSPRMKRTLQVLPTSGDMQCDIQGHEYGQFFPKGCNEELAGKRGFNRETELRGRTLDRGLFCLCRRDHLLVGTEMHGISQLIADGERLLADSCICRIKRKVFQRRSESHTIQSFKTESADG